MRKKKSKKNVCCLCLVVPALAVFFFLYPHPRPPSTFFQTTFIFHSRSSFYKCFSKLNIQNAASRLLCLGDIGRGEREGERKRKHRPFRTVSSSFCFEVGEEKETPKTRAPPKRESGGKSKEKIRVVHDSVICKVLTSASWLRQFELTNKLRSVIR